MPAGDVNTPLSATSRALSIRLKPGRQTRRATCSLTSETLSREVRVLQGDVRVLLVRANTYKYYIEITLGTSLMPAAGVNTSLSARSIALSIRLKPGRQTRRATCPLTSETLRREPVNVFNFRTKSGSLLYRMSAM